MRAALIALLVAGCRYQSGAASSSAIDGAIESDAKLFLDAPPDGFPECIVVPEVGVNLCPATPPMGPLHITTTTALNTGDGATMPPNPAITCAMMKAGSTPPMVCAIVATTITIDAGVTLSAFGGKPLVLIAMTSIDIEGTIDVSSHVGGKPGPGPMPSCSAGTPSSMNGGGQGGSFGGANFGVKAGNGGDGDSNPGSGGIAGNPLTISALTAGCPGKAGAGGGMGGAAGGVVLIATPQLKVGDSGQINASGAGGRGSTPNHKGGGGAGSGGLIVLSAAVTLTGNGQIFANGSTGGGGAGGSPGADGTDPTGPTSGGGGGAGDNNSGSGGTGGWRGANPQPGTAGTGGNADGGGGGGGGVGAILIRPMSLTLSNNSNVSPIPI